jgi:hypothetical protein
MHGWRNGASPGYLPSHTSRVVVWVPGGSAGGFGRFSEYNPSFRLIR